MVTVASSTNIPMERASPLKVIMLIVYPSIYSAHTADNIAIGMVSTTIIAPRVSPKNSRITNPVNTAPNIPS
ncbi:hypothetical protein D3C79_1095680 [compost metagenome]